MFPGSGLFGFYRSEVSRVATRENIYAQQLKELGIYEKAFEPLIKELAQKERRRQRLQKAWAATAAPGGKPSFLDPHYQLLVQVERETLALREALGLTPKSLRKLRGAPDAPIQQDLIADKLDAIKARVEGYGLGDLPTDRETEAGDE